MCRDIQAIINAACCLTVISLQMYFGFYQHISTSGNYHLYHEK